MDAYRKRLIFRARYMGTNENDLLFGTFAERHIADMSESELAAFAALLDETDPDLFDWVTGRKTPPQRHDTPILQKLRAFTLVADPL